MEPCATETSLFVAHMYLCATTRLFCSSASIDQNKLLINSIIHESSQWVYQIFFFTIWLLKYIL